MVRCDQPVELVSIEFKKMFLSIKGVICFNFLCYSNACDLPSIFLQEPVLGEEEVSLLEQYDDPIGVVKKLDRVREKSSGLIYFDSRMFHFDRRKRDFCSKNRNWPFISTNANEKCT